MENTLGNAREKEPVEIIELSPDEWKSLRDLKIKSLQEEPIAFEDQESGFKEIS